ncbi:MAG: nucleotidyltransferase family protein [Hellea sp.]|nr:nucleotidyltransferase family protein [Hellea sp.]
MVMAAGHGTRMKPLTDDRSKAMVEVGGRPLIDHTLARLSEASVTKAVVNIHAHADHLEAHLGNRKMNLEILISDERGELLETGGGLIKALPLLGSDPIFICNIDAIWQENSAVLEAMTKFWDPEMMDDLLLLAPIEQTLGYSGNGDFTLSKDGRIARRDGESAPYVYAGVQIARLEPARGFKIEPFSRNKMWDLSLANGRAYGFILDGFWMHVGDPKARGEAEARLNDI